VYNCVSGFNVSGRVPACPASSATTTGHHCDYEARYRPARPSIANLTMLVPAVAGPTR
jgi:hypothetical protein